MKKEKKQCRWCQTENSKKAPFCVQCGRPIQEEPFPNKQPVCCFMAEELDTIGKI